MSQSLDEHTVKCAELTLSRYFEKSGTRKVPAQTVIQHGKASGFYRAEIKEARKRLGVESVNEDGVYWWSWPDSSNPEETSKRLNDELLEEIKNDGKGD